MAGHREVLVEQTDDWVRVFVDGTLIANDHRLDTRNVIAVLKALGATVHYQWVEPEIAEAEW